MLSSINSQYEKLYENISEIKMSSNEEIEIILSEEPTHIYFGKTNIDERIKHLVEFSKFSSKICEISKHYQILHI